MRKLSRFAVPAAGLSVVALAGQLAGLACSTSTTDSAAGAQTGNDAGDASPAVPDASPDGTTSAGCAEHAAIDEAAAKVVSEADDGRHSGFVGIQQLRDENGAYSNVFFGQFSIRAEDAGDAGLPSCTTTTIGNCTLRACALVDAGVPPAPTRPASGDLSVTSERIANGTCNALEFASTSNGTGFRSGKLYEPGDELTVRGAGDPSGVPPFSVKLVGAIQLDTTTPALGGYDTPNVFSKSSDGTMAWSPTGPGTVEIVFQDSDGVNARVLTCREDAAKGSMTIPKEAFASFPSVADGERSGGIIVEARSVKSVAAGKYRFDVGLDTTELHGWYRVAD